MNIHRKILLRCSLGLSLPAIVVAGEGIAPTTGIPFSVLGKVAPRSASEIASSPWSIGGETLDRDFATYAHYKKYLGPLGAKHIRLQAGWAKCEKTKGVYDFAWLDAIVDDARAQGVQPWLELSYGNTIYPGGGDTGLGGGFPSSPEALAAWDRWVTAIVRHFADRVHEWEIWNEPDINKAGTAMPEAYVDLHIRTATIIRAGQPNSLIIGLGLAHMISYAESVLTQLHQRGKIDLIDAITIHVYPRNPDETGYVEKLREIIAKLGRPIEVRQGETGAPSRYQENFALRNITWTENTQAKWDLRRLLAHRAKDVPMNLFTISDMHYTTASNQGGADGVLRMNYKGLLGTNADQSISHAKLAYHAAQGVFTIFDDTLGRIEEYPFKSTALRSMALTGYQRRAGGAQVVAYWFSDAPPAESNGVTRAEVILAKGSFQEPVLVDLLTGEVYVIPTAMWSKDAGGIVFRGLPIYDSPMLIAEREIIPLKAAAR